MLGDFETLLGRTRAELRTIGVAETASGDLAVDLGAGSGAHAIALAQLGYEVVAIDDCGSLLEELRGRSAGLSVQAVQDDLRRFRAHVTRPAKLILCMGDTLTHLPEPEDVDALLEEAVAALSADGAFVTTFRDYVAVELKGTDRFISVQASSARIMTCFLEYSVHTVTVHDVLHECVHGQWRMRVSNYQKQRLDPKQIASKLAALGCTVRIDAGMSGMVRILASRSHESLR
jgi:hypothetical protein